MRDWIRQKALGLTVVLLTALAGAAPALAANKPCDRICLEGLVGAYLAALPTHSPAKLPLASANIRFIENDQVLKLGDGTWATIGEVGKYRHIFSDPQMGQAAVITTVKENGVAAIFDLRIRVVNRKIAEAESQIIRDPRGAARYEALGVPEALWLQAAPPADRVSRDVLIATANKYFQGMQHDDPKGDYSFFDPDCNRLEHAEQTTNLKTPQAYGHSNDTDFSSMGCQAQFQTGFLGFVTGIRDRRFEVVDEERQSLFSFADLDHNGTVRLLHMSTGKDFVVPAYFDVPRTLQVGEAFRMRHDRIHRIEMTLTELPYGMRPADAPAEPARSKPAVKPTCDRACLGDLLERLLQAIVDHDPTGAPLAANVRYTENGQVLKPGDGLWGTATAIAMPGDGLARLGPHSAAYKLSFADPLTGQVGFLGSVNENGTAGIMALRLRTEAGKIADIEAVIVRDETTGPRGGTVTLFRPRLLAEFNPKGFDKPDPALTAALAPTERTPRKAMAEAVTKYLDAIEKGYSNGVMTWSDCVRRDNGGQTTGNANIAPLDPAAPAFKPFALGCAAQLDGGLHWISKVRDRRVLLIDEERGLVLALGMVDHTGAVTSLTTPNGPVNLPSNLLTPSTDMTAAVFLVKAGRISRIEAVERPVPYGMTSGWTE